MTKGVYSHHSLDPSRFSGCYLMPILAAISRWEALALVVGFCLVIGWNLLVGRIRLSGLLSGERANGEAYFSYGRAQLLVVLLFTAGQYLRRVYLDPSNFPKVPNASLALFGGSAVLYTGEKAWALVFSRSRNSTRRIP